MERIKLSKKCKALLRSVNDGSYPKKASPEDVDDIRYLREMKLIQGVDVIPNGVTCIRITDFGRAYFHDNPKLKNPTIWQDKKYIINTAISIVALVISIIALIKK